MADNELIIAGGGTGGHVLAGVAIADEWKAKSGTPPLFVGSVGGIEEKLVPRAGYRLECLRLGALKGVSTAKRVYTLALLPWSFVKSALILVRTRPRAVIGVGGYASGPLVLIARMIGWLWGVRVAILEQNAVPGFTNRILGRLAHRVFSAFPGVEASFPRAKVQVTGNPVRSSITYAGPASRVPFTIFIFGGSQGAIGINSLVLDALPLLEDLKPRLRFIHQTGQKDYERVLEGHRVAGTAARVEKFIHDMPACYAESSLLVCRAGSGTLAEIASAGRAAILVPFPFASDNHQEKNARIFVDAGAARLLVQFKSTGADLAAQIRELIGQPDRLAAMEEAVRPFHRPHSAKEIVAALAD
jgi:UDP-N-acetylglucosamine--N-acetylmuramyl-(pentapeptide) pyrophosphoryl-undecaprenol N-acetylglucosamine transferase